MKLKIATLLWCAMSLLAACEQDPELPSGPMPEPVPENAMRTMLVYIAADNSLSGNLDFASLDLQEMVQGMERVDTRNNNLIVYMDRAGVDPELIRICRSKEGEIMLDTVHSYSARNSVGITELKEVLSRTFTDFPAKHYALSMWSHGEGWLPYDGPSVRWIGQDKKNYMNIQDFHAALQGAPHLDFILFDACFMQSVEVAYELRDCADYFIASPTEIPGPGAPYDQVVSAIFPSSETPVEEVAKNIVQHYFQPYAAIFNGEKMTPNTPWTGGVSVGAFKSSALERLAAVTKPILQKYVVEGGPVKTSGFLYYGRGSRYYYYYDLDDLIYSLTSGEGMYAEWKQAFDAAMVLFLTTSKNYSRFESQSAPVYGLFSMEGACGVSTYIPRANSTSLNNFYRNYAWYTDAGWSLTGW